MKRTPRNSEAAVQETYDQAWSKWRTAVESLHARCSDRLGKATTPEERRAAQTEYQTELAKLDPLRPFRVPPESKDLPYPSEEGRTVAAQLRWGRIEREYQQLMFEVPTPEQYKDFLLKKLVPAWNAFHVSTLRCIECGRVFAVRDGREKRSLYCDDATCGVRVRQRGRDKVDGGRSSAEIAAKKLGERVRRHVGACAQCRNRAYCPIYEGLQFGASEAYARVDVDVGVAEKIAARDGNRHIRARPNLDQVDDRKPKRKP